jgi:DHA2 family multidrug resistance protein
VGLVSVFIVSTFLKDSAHRRDTSSIDWLGIGLLTVGLASLQYVLEEGKRYDWWDSVAITRLAITAGICLTVFIFWELSPRNRLPVVDLHVLKDRGLSAAVVIGMALGFGLYGGIFIFPLFTQSVLGFSPTETGLVLLPGGLATAVMVIFCGRVLQRGFDPRILIVAGMLVYMVSMWMLGHLTPQSGIPDTQLGLIVRGLGLGLLFVPIAVTAFAGLKGAQIQQGSALYNLARQIGGSIGIAVLNTYVTDMEAYHRADLVSRITSASTSVSARIASTQQAIVNHGLSPQTAHAMAFRVLDHTIQMQAATMSYNDGFLLLGITFIFAFPAVALLRRPRIGVRAAGAH